MSSSTAKSPYAGYRFPAVGIGHVWWLYFRFPLSLRMVEEMLAARGGTLKLSRAWPAGPWAVDTRNELFDRQVALCRLPLPGRGNRPRLVALLSLSAQPAHGGRDAGRSRRHPQVEPGLAGGAMGGRHSE